jgi:hypothetical protein
LLINFLRAAGGRLRSRTSPQKYMQKGEFDR